MAKMKGIGAFNDDIRDAIKGNVFDALDKGFVNGGLNMEESIKFGVVGAVYHPQAAAGWAVSPSQSINYISCHDNFTFWDKLAISNADDSKETRIRMNKLGSAVLLTSQGVAFFQAGEEMLRSKPSDISDTGFDENSYNSPDSTNSIKWDNKADVRDICEYYKGLIAFRKAHSALRMTTAADIRNDIVFADGLEANVVAYTISNKPNNETADKIMVIFNANRSAVNVTLPSGVWDICVNAVKAGTASLGTVRGSVSVDAVSAMVLVQGDIDLKRENVTIV